MTIHEHDYDHDLAGRTHTRTFHQEMALAFSALDCALNGRRGVYASTELTTGQRAYALMRSHRAASLAELRRSLGDGPFGEAVLDRNVEAGSEFARRLHERLGGTEVVVTPGPFAAPGWTQREYLHFWETLIRTRVHAVYFNDGWEYSNGCTFEYAIAAEAGLPTFDSACRPLPVERAVTLVSGAARELERDGIDVTRLYMHLERIGGRALAPR